MAIRIADAIADLLGDASCVVAVVSDPALPDRWSLPPDVRVVVDHDATASVPDGQVVTVVDVRPDTPPSRLEKALRRLSEGGNALLLLQWVPNEVPAHLVIEAAVQADAQVIGLMPLADRGFQVGAVVVRGRPLTWPKPYLGPGRHDLPDAGGDERRVMLRLAGEHAFLALRQRSLRKALEQAQNGLLQQTAHAEELEEARAALASKSAELTERLASTSHELAVARGQLHNLERSRAVRAARALRRLPRPGQTRQAPPA
jgi:hypothetical protein